MITEKARAELREIQKEMEIWFAEMDKKIAEV